MPQISTKPAPAKKLIDAGIPQNISAVDMAALKAGWNEKARLREEAIANETRTPKEATLTLRYQLRKFGHHWNSYAANSSGKMVPLLNAPSLLSSAIDALSDRMTEEAIRI